MVHRLETVLFLGPLKERELRDPQELKLILLQKIQLPCDLKTQVSEHVPDHLVLVRREEQKVTRLSAHRLHQGIQFFRLHELREGGLVSAVRIDGKVSKTLRAVGLGELDQRVDLLSRHRALSLRIDAADTAACLNGVREYAESAVLHDIRDIMKLHAEPEVRLVGTVVVHCLLPGHAAEGHLYVNVQHLLEQALHETLIDVDHIVHVDKGKLHVDLGELRLTVRAEILVTVAAGQLEIAVIPGAHQKLLQELRGLGQRIHLSGMDTAGDQIVTGALRGALDQGRSLDLKETVLRKECAGLGRNFGTGHDVPLDIRSAEIQETVLQAEFFPGLGILLDREGRRLGLGEDAQLIRADLQFSCCQLLVRSAFALLQGADHCDAVFAAEGCCLCEHLRSALSFLKSDLQDARAVAEIRENDSALVAASLDPAHDGDDGTDLCIEYFRAAVGPLQALHRFRHD